MLLFKLSNSEIVIEDADKKLDYGSIKAFIIRPGNDNFYKPVLLRAISVSCSEGIQKIEWAGDSCETAVRLILKQREDLWDGGSLAGKIIVEGKGSGIARLVWEVPEDSYFPFVPGFMYGYNRGGDSKWATYPQLTDKTEGGYDKPWKADEWLVRTDRSTHGVTSLIGTNTVFAIGGRDVCRYGDGSFAEKTGIGISNSVLHRISFSLGFCNVPYTYSAVQGRNYSSRPEGYVDLGKGPAETDIFFAVANCSSRFSGVSGLLRKCFRLQHDDADSKGTVPEAAEAVSEALAAYGYCSRANNFYVTMSYNKGAEDAAYSNGLFNTAWAGGLRTAYPLLAAGCSSSNKKWIEIACSVFDNISNNALSGKSGLFYENFDPVKEEWNSCGWWYRMLESPGHSGYINGQACYYILKAYICLKENGELHEQWLNAAGSVLDRVAAMQDSDGGFGYTYNERDGSILDKNGFSGCWFTPAFAIYCSITGNEKYLLVAERAMAYYRSFVMNFEVFGGPHDIFKSPDEEGILAFIKAAHILHENTGKPEYLQDLEAGLEYEFSWKFSYNVVNELEPLKSRNWCSTGGSVTSVNNSHIHPMGSSILGSIAYAARSTNDEYYARRYTDTLKWTLSAYLHYDGDYDWGRKGLINERFCYTDSLLVERYPDGSPASTWFCAHSWASGAVLEGLMEIVP